MSAGTWDIYIEKGAQFRRVLTVRNDDDTLLNFTGYTARLQVRGRAVADDLLADWSDKLTLGGSAGTITLLLTDDETGALEWSRGVHALEIESGSGETTRLLEGSVTLSPEVTR